MLKRIHPATVRRGGQLEVSATRLRVGALVDARDMRRWHSLVLRELLDADFCEPTILIARRRASIGRARSLSARLAGVRASYRHLLYRLYERADRRKFALAGDPLSPASLEDLAIESVQRSPGAGTRDVDLSDAANDGLAREGFDVLLCLTADADLRSLGSCASFGAMSFEGAEDMPPFRATSVNRDIVSAVQLVSGRYGERVLCRSSTSTEPLSLRRNRNATHAKAPHLLLRALSDLHRRGPSAIVSAPLVDTPLIARRSAPTNIQMLPFLWRVYVRRAQVRFRGYLFVEQWYLAYRRQCTLERSAWGTRRHTAARAPWKVICPPTGLEYSDPFVLRRGDRHVVFFEDYDPRIQRGAISYMEIDRDGRRSEPRRALEREYHLSYPFVFCDGDAVYLLPETRSEHRIELYRATRFPDEWKLEHVLMEGVSGADPTLLRHDATFWLFVAVAPGGGPPLDELHLFYSDSLLGEWRPHPMNPVVADAGRARPAGRIFLQGDGLIRPAQDCASSYGRRVVLNRIEVLDRTDYRESVVGLIEPSRRGGARKTHTYNFDGDYEFLDGWRLYPRFRVPGLGPWSSNRALGRFNFALSEPGPSSVTRR